MKLHLPRTLRTAVLTCMAVAGGFATTTATGVLAAGSLVIAFATPQAQAAVDYSVYADYAFSIYQWTGPTSGGNKGIVSRGYWYEMEYSSGALNYKLANGEKIPSGTYDSTNNFKTYLQSDKTLVFDANSNCFANAQFGTYAANTCYIYDCDGAAVGALVVKADAAGVVLLASKSEVDSRDVILGASNTENTSYSIFEKDFTIDTRASDITLRGKQQWQVAEGATFKLGAFGNNTKSVNQSGVLTIAGDGTVLMNNKLVVASDALISVNSGATLTLAALDTTSTATITNNGTLNINGNITLTGSLYEYAEKQAATKTYSEGNGNGYLSLEGDAQYWIVQGTGVVTLASGVTITDADGVTHTAQQDAGKGLYISMTVDEDTLDYYITTEGVAVDMSATGAGESGAAESYVLNGGIMELSGGTLAGDKVRSLKDSTIDIAATGVLTRLTNVDHTVTLTGSGTYDMGNSATVNVAGLTESGWEGTVAIGGGTTALTVTEFSFNKYGNAASAVEVSGVSGWLTTNVTYLPEVIFTQNETLGYAMLVNNGGSNSNQTFGGAVSGDGTLKIAFSGGSLTNMHFNFTGDVAGWKSEDGSTTPEIYIATPSKTTHVAFSGSATEINADTYVHQGTLNLTLTNDKAVTINGSLTQQGGTQSVFNMTVTNSADTTFYNTVNVHALTNSGTGAIVVGSKVVDGVEMSGALTVKSNSSLGAITLAGGTAEIAGTSSISTLSILAESADAALTAKGALTLTNVAVDCTGWTGISADKVYTLATAVDGGSLNWADTTKQSVSGIDTSLALDGQVSMNEAGDIVLSFIRKEIGGTVYWNATTDEKWSDASWKNEDDVPGYITEGASTVFSGAGDTPAQVVVDTDAVVTDMTVSDGSYTFSEDATNGGSLTVTDTLSIGADGSATFDMEASVKNIELQDSTSILTINKALTITEGGKLTATNGGTIVNGMADDATLVISCATIGGFATKEGDVVSGNGLKLEGSNFALTDITLTGQIDNTNADSIQLGGTIVLDTVAMGDLIEGLTTTYHDQTGVTLVAGANNGYIKESMQAQLFTKAEGVIADPLEGVSWLMTDGAGEQIQADVSTQDGLMYYISSSTAGTEYVAADADVAAVYDANEALFSERATGIVLNGGDLILNTGLDKSEGSKLVNGICAEKDATVTITEGVTLDSSDLTRKYGATVTLLGGGTYDLGAANAMNSGVEVGTASGWQGTVTTAATDVTDLSTLGNSASTVDLTGDVVTTALSTGNVGTVKVKSLVAETLNAANSDLTVAGATTLAQDSTVGKAAFDGGLTLGTEDAAATLTGGELSLSKLTLASVDSKVKAASLSNSTLDINISDSALSSLSRGETRTLVSVSNDSSLASLSFNGEADCTLEEYGAKYFYTIGWQTLQEVMPTATDDASGSTGETTVTAVVLSSTKNDNYVFEAVEPTTENGKAGVQLLNDLFVEIDPQSIQAPTAGEEALAELIDAVDDGDMTDESAAALAGSSISALGLALSGDVERQLRSIRNRTTTMGVNECVVNEGMPYFNAWFNAESNRTKLDADGTNPGYTLDSWGGTVGFDVDVNPNLTMGLAISAMYGSINTEGPDMLDGDMDTYYLSLFARYADCAWTHTFVATLGKMDGSYSRTVNVGEGYKTEADIDGSSFGLMYEVGYVIPLDEDADACVQPIFNVMLRHSSVGSIEEKGTGAGLAVDKQGMTTLTFGLGARLQAVVGESVYNRASIFEGRILAKADLGDRQSEAEVALLNGTGRKATVKSAELGTIGLEIGAGLTIPLGDDDGSLFFDGSVELRSGYTDVNGTVGYRINF